jgi:hypothetical protein
VKQYVVGKTYGTLGNQSDYPVYTALRGNLWEQGGHPHEKFQFSHPWSVAGSFKHLYVEIVHPEENPAGNGWPDIAFTLYINDAPTALTVTVPAHASNPSPTPGMFMSSAQNTTASVTISPGDRVAIGRGTGTIEPGVNQYSVMVAWSLTFESDNDGESGYGVSSWGVTNLPASAVLYSAPFNGQGGFSGGSEAINEIQSHSVVPLIGSLTRLDVQIDTAPGAGAHRTFAAMLNGVLQDGSGGTVDTQVTLGAADTDAFGEFTLPLAVLDRLAIVQLISGGTAPATALLTYSVAVTAATDGQSALSFDTANANPINDGSTDYATGQGGGWAWTTSAAPTPSTNPSRWPMSEFSMSLPGPIDTFTLSGLCVNFSTAPGGSTSYLFTTRAAFANTSSVNTMTGTDVLTVGSGNASFGAVTDRLDLQAVGTDTPAATRFACTWLITETTAPPIVSTSYPIRRLRRFALPFAQNKWIRISRVELILQAGVGLSTGQGSDPIVMFRLSRDGGMTWDDELTMSMGKIGEYERRAFLLMLGRARNPVVELTSSDPVFVSWISFTVDYEEGTS